VLVSGTVILPRQLLGGQPHALHVARVQHPARDDGFLVAYSSPFTAEYPAEMNAASNVKAEDVPKSYQDLLDPR
jgi:hypothetical protein